MSHRRWLVPAAALLVLAPGIWAALQRIQWDEASADLERAATAHRWVSFAGLAGWTAQGRDLPARLRHDARTGRTEYHWGPVPMVLEAPSTRMPDPTGWCLDPEAAAANYRASDAGGTTFLGRSARILTLAPRHDGRPTLRLTIDAATALPLEVATTGYDGAPYRTVAFREIAFGPQEVPAPAPLTCFRSLAGASVALDRLDEACGFRILRPDYVPEGFRLLDSRAIDRMAGMARLTYTDGVTTFEITEAPILTPAQTERLLREQLGDRRAECAIRSYRRERARALSEAAEPTPGGAVVRRRKGPTHHTYSLEVGDLSVTLCARADLDPAHVVPVLESLR